MKSVPDRLSVPLAWRHLTQALPLPAQWHDIASSKPGSELRIDFSSASTALQLVANLADADGLRESYESLNLRPGTQLLDAACGPAVSSQIAASFGHDVTAVDNSPAMLDVARLGPDAETIELVHADLRQSLPWPDKHFQSIVVGDWWDDAFLPELLRILAPDGTLWVRLSNIVPPVLYTQDSMFNTRMWEALTAGYRQHFGDAGEATLHSLHEAGFQHSHDISLRHDPHRRITAYRFALAFTLWESRFIQDHVNDDDWNAALAYWNPSNSQAWWTDPRNAATTWLSHWKLSRSAVF